MVRNCLLTLAVVAFTATSVFADSGLKKGTIDLKSVGPLAFGPDGVLFISDPMSATIHAVATGKSKGKASGKLEVEGVRAKLAGLLGAERKDVRIIDVAVKPGTSSAYLAVVRGSGPEANAVIAHVQADGTIEEFSLEGVPTASAKLPNPADPRPIRGGNARMQSITDMHYVNGRLFIAGLSNENFASNLRAIPYPFSKSNRGTGVKIYHGAHGAFETRSPVRTFTAYDIGGKTHLLAAYTCTPLVKFPVDKLQPGQEIVGTTIAELGNRNRPLDMFTYSKGGKDFILMANSSRGVMKIPTAGIGDVEKGIEAKVPSGETKGIGYDTIASLKGVLQLDRLNDKSALALVEVEDGTENLTTVALP